MPAMAVSHLTETDAMHELRESVNAIEPGPLPRMTWRNPWAALGISLATQPAQLGGSGNNSRWLDGAIPSM